MKQNELVAWLHEHTTHVPYVVGVDRAAGDEAGRAFTEGFYEGIGAGESIEQAVQRGSPRIQPHGLPDHLAPVLKENKAALRVPEDSERPSWLHRRTQMQQWVFLLAGIVTILGFIFNLPQKIEGMVRPESARLWGIVLNTDEQPVADALIDVRREEGADTRIGHATTNTDGTFSFVVKSKSEESVWVTVSLDGRVGYEGYLALLGNKRIVLGGDER